MTGKEACVFENRVPSRLSCADIEAVLNLEILNLNLVLLVTQLTIEFSHSRVTMVVEGYVDGPIPLAHSY